MVALFRKFGKRKQSDGVRALSRRGFFGAIAAAPVAAKVVAAEPPMMLIPKGTKIDIEIVNRRPGSVITHNCGLGGFVPGRFMFPENSLRHGLSYPQPYITLQSANAGKPQTIPESPEERQSKGN
jgi:hypothetical protein